MGEEDVRSIAARLAEEYADPHELAEAVLRELGFDPSRLRAALSIVLPGYVSGIARSSRNQHLTAARQVRSGHEVKSAKVAGIRSWFARWLDETLHTADGWKRIRETTREDWLFAAKERADHIAAETVRMEQCERIAALFKRCRAKTAADLPESAVLDVFGEEAA